MVADGHPRVAGRQQWTKHSNRKEGIERYKHPRLQRKITKSQKAHPYSNVALCSSIVHMTQDLCSKASHSYNHMSLALVEDGNADLPLSEFAYPLNILIPLPSSIQHPHTFFCSFTKPSVLGHLILSNGGRECLRTLTLYNKLLQGQSPKVSRGSRFRILANYLDISLSHCNQTPGTQLFVWASKEAVPELLSFLIGFLKEKERGKKKKKEDKKKLVKSPNQIMFCLHNL